MRMLPVAGSGEISKVSSMVFGGHEERNVAGGGFADRTDCLLLWLKMWNLAGRIGLHQEYLCPYYRL